MPPPQLKVSEWADKNRYLTAEETSRPGLWKTDEVPYLRMIMDILNDDDIEMVVFLKAAQVGFTEALINYMGYTIDQDPSRVLYVMPDDDTAKEFSENRLQKFLRSSAVLRDKFKPNDSKDLLLSFHGGFIKLSSAQSPAKLASWSIPKVLMDEIDKFPKWTGKEASPLKLAEERTKNWSKRKIILGSTPTVRSGHINQAWDAVDVKYKYQVPCPHCGEFQPLQWANVKFSKDDDLTVIRTKAYYECPYCHEHIFDYQKPEMLSKGKWVAQNTTEGKAKSVGFSINSLYSPWITFGKMAVEFMKSKNEPATLMNFVNSWLGEFWESKTTSINARAVSEQKTNLASGIVPEWAMLLTGGVDCQQGYFYWVIRAWGPNMKSQKIACGQAVTFGDVQRIMDKFWTVEGSKHREAQVMLYCIDSGYNTEEVYEFCYANMNLAIPVKGSSRQFTPRYKISYIQPKDQNTRWITSLKLYEVDTDQYKNLIASHLAKKNGTDGAWMVDADTDEEYASQICSEHKILIEKNGIATEKWEQITSARQNHYLDCEVYAWVAADIMNVRYLSSEQSSNTSQAEEVEMIPKEFSIKG